MVASDIHGKNSYGNTPLMLSLCNYTAASYDRFCELIDLGSDVNTKNMYGSTPLHRACDRADTRFLKRLLECPDIDVNAEDSNHRSPLLECCIHGRDEHLQLLLAAGADPNVEDRHGMTPLFKTTKVSTARLLVTYGADINHQDKKLRSVLHYLCEFSATAHKRLITYLVQAGIDVDLTNWYDQTALEYLVANKRAVPKCMVAVHNEIIEILDALPPYDSPRLDKRHSILTGEQVIRPYSILLAHPEIPPIVEYYSNPFNTLTNNIDTAVCDYQPHKIDIGDSVVENLESLTDQHSESNILDDIVVCEAIDTHTQTTNTTSLWTYILPW